MNEDNVVEFKRPDRRDEPPSNRPQPQPFINLPPVTKCLLIGLIAIHAVLYVLAPENTRAEIFLTFGFVPYLWTDGNMFGMNPLSYLSPLTYMALHGSLLHLFMNGTMLMAFGAGVERLFGATRYIAFFILCGLLSLVPEILFHPDLQAPMVGASGAISGLFAAILIVLQRENRLPAGKYGIWPFAIVWVGISVVFGLFGTQLAGAPIAWLAHLGGFFGGMLLLRLPYFRI